MVNKNLSDSEESFEIVPTLMPVTSILETKCVGDKLGMVLTNHVTDINGLTPSSYISHQHHILVTDPEKRHQHLKMAINITMSPTSLSSECPHVW